MTARPGQWDLLGHGSDPVPGTPSEVSSEGTHYTGVARTISDQIDRLRRLAEPDAALVGHYADKLTESCNDLADHLGKIEERFHTTGSQLTEFSSDLSDARTKTWTALQAAEAAKQQLDANAPVDVPAGSPEPTQAEKDATEARAGRHSAAEGALGAAKSDCDSAMSSFNDAAESVASAIKDASDDDMKDSTWDKFKDFVGSIAGVLDAIADVLGWIATALVIVALFIPGLNILVIAAVLLTAALLLHTLLAATGNGSWLDVAFDVIGLATLGIGSTAATAAKAGRAATLTAAGRTAGSNASARVLTQASFNGGRGIIGGVHKFVLRNFSTTVRSGMRTAYDDAFRAWTQRSLPQSSVLEGMRAGMDRSLASLVKDHRMLVRELGQEAVTPAFTRNLHIALGANVTSVVADAVPKLANPKIGPYAEGWKIPAYGDLSDRMKTTIGGPF